MIKKKPIIENEVKWGKKSTLSLILVIGGLVGLILSITVLPEYLRTKKLKGYDGIASGYVTSITSNKITSQGFEGMKSSTSSYNVRFTYRVSDIEYINSNLLPNKGIYRKFIDEMRISNLKKNILIRYDLNNPQDSFIQLE